MMKNKKILCHDARSLAVEILQNVFNKTPIQSALDFAINNSQLSAKDVALCTELVYGYTRYKLRIDFILDTLLRDQKSLPNLLLITLGISTYSILFLSKIPNYATVNWAVEYVKLKFGLKLSKLCNGVLRSLLRLEDKPKHISFYDSLCQFYSVPNWIYELWIKSYGEVDSQKLFSKALERPRTSLRLNPNHSSYNMLKSFLMKSPHYIAIGFDGFICLDSNFKSKVDNINFLELHNDGAFSWQSSGSQVALYNCFKAVPALKQQMWFDACAGQGGKSLALIEQGIGVCLASDISFSRLKQFQRNCKRLKLATPFLLRLSAESIALIKSSYNVLLDVPCSGLGTLGRRPDIKLHRTQNDLHNLVALQYRILESAWNYISPSRYILYLTCTLNPDENNLLVDKFLLQHNDASLIYSWETPTEHPWLDGMFACVIKKQ